jgi:hypothetical protein
LRSTLAARPTKKEIALRKDSKKIVAMDTAVQATLRTLLKNTKSPAKKPQVGPVKLGRRESIETWLTPETKARAIRAACLLNIRCDEVITAAVSLLCAGNKFRIVNAANAFHARQERTENGNPHQR